ncbi:hypothetical protein L7F22_008361 [Adiantum nelumboides]|nr:hypothetical protein [Adiantum nelumboides]
MASTAVTVYNRVLIVLSVASDQLPNHSNYLHELRRLKVATVRTIQSPDGDVIHCVRREKQPALDHPLLRGHTLQDSPSYVPKELEEVYDRSLSHIKASPFFGVFGTQLWHRKGRCPQNTVPIRRPPYSYHLPTHHARRHYYSNASQTSKDHNFILFKYCMQYAIGQLDQDSIYGTYAIFNAWKPFVAKENEFSLAQIWLVAGNYSDTSLDTIEVGWTVSPQAYGDNNTRFFMFWTNDFYKSGCLDLRCPGFVQVSNDMVLGGTIGPTSSPERQLEMQPILVWKEKVTGNWWLRIGMTHIGYWPASLFKNGLQEKARRVQWGGEITNTFTGGLHTTTQMGSGSFAQEGFGKACYARSLHIVDSSNALSPVPTSIGYVTSNPTCYTVSHASNQAWGSAFYFGGPGLNPNCQ